MYTLIISIFWDTSTLYIDSYRGTSTLLFICSYNLERSHSDRLAVFGIHLHYILVVIGVHAHFYILVVFGIHLHYIGS